MCTLSVSLLALASAQVAPSFETPTAAERPVLYDESSEGDVLASGATWKAEFGPDGVVYTPFFGSAAPRNFPVGFELGAVTLAGESMSLVDAPRVARGGDTVTTSHGATREVWHLEPWSAEQTFVFDSLPASGELRLSIDFETELAPVAGEGGALDFVNAFGRVRYGDAIAVDANGDTVAVARVDRQGGFDLVVPADFVASAALPLVVDPVVTTITDLHNGVNEQRNPDVAYGRSNIGSGGLTRWLVVWEEVISAGDIDLYGMYVVPSGIAAPSTLRIIDSGSDSWFEPSVAFHVDAQRFLTAATRIRNNRREIWGRTMDLGSTSQTHQAAIAQSTTAQYRSPCVSGNEHDETGARSLVVWEAEVGPSNIDILGRVVTGWGATEGPVIGISTGSTNDIAPRVNRGLGAEYHGYHWHNITWTRRNSSIDVVWSRQMTEGGIAMTAERLVSLGSRCRSADPTSIYEGPEDSAGTLPFFVGWQTDTQKEHRLTTLSNATSTRGIELDEREGFATNESVERTNIASYGHGAALVYTVARPGGYGLRLTTMGLTSELISGATDVGVVDRRVQITNGLDNAFEFAIASAHDGGADNDSCVVVYIVNDELQGVLVDPTGSDIAPAFGGQYCNATSNATGERGWLWGIGSSDVHSVKEIHAESLPPNSFGYLLVAPSQGYSNPPGSFGPLCIAGSVGRYVDQIRQADAAGSMSFFVLPGSIPTPLGPHAAQPGDSFMFQAWYRDTQGGQVGSNFTIALAANFE